MFLQTNLSKIRHAKSERVSQRMSLHHTSSHLSRADRARSRCPPDGDGRAVVGAHPAFKLTQQHKDTQLTQQLSTCDGRLISSCGIVVSRFGTMLTKTMTVAGK